MFNITIEENCHRQIFILSHILFILVLQGMWCGVIHHAIGEHEWILPYRVGGKSCCEHGPLTEEKDKDYLVAGSTAHVALREIVLDKRLLKKIPYFLHCRYQPSSNAKFYVN